MAPLHLPFSPDSPQLCTFLLLEGRGYGLRCSLSFSGDPVSLLTEARQQRQPPRRPLGNLETDFSARRATLLPKSCAKNECEAWKHSEYKQYMGQGDASKETFLGTNKMLLLRKGLHQPSKSSLKCNHSQSPVTHIGLKEVLLGGNPWLLCV